MTTAPRGIRRLAPIAALSGTALIVAAAAAGSATASTPPSDVSGGSAPAAGADRGRALHDPARRHLPRDRRVPDELVARSPTMPSPTS